MNYIRNIHKGEFGMEGEVYFSLYNRFIALRYDEDVSTEYVEKSVNYLNSLSESTIDTICYYSLKFCRHTISDYEDVDYEDGLRDVTNPKDILKYIHPMALIVDEPKDEQIPAINLYCDCAWDEDNQMQVLIRGDQVVYVGPFDGLDPWLDNLSEWCNYVTGYGID